MVHVEGHHHTSDTHLNPSPYTGWGYTGLLTVMRIGLGALAWRHSPRHAFFGALIGASGQLVDRSQKPTGDHGGGCGSTDFAELLADAKLYPLPKLLLPALFVVAHLDKKLLGCCGDAEAFLMSAVVTTYVWNKVV